MDLYEVVTKLVGPVEPVGETREDERRFENLEQLCKLTERLLIDIDSVGMSKSNHQFSVKRAGEYADKWLTRQGITE